MNAPTPPDQPEDAALLTAIANIVGDIVGDFNSGGNIPDITKTNPDEMATIMQLFHDQQAKAVQAAEIRTEHYWIRHYANQRSHYDGSDGDMDAINEVKRHQQLHKDRLKELQSTQPPAADTPLPSNELCFDCGNKTFWYDNAYRCIYDGTWHEVPPAADTTKQGEGE